VEKITVPVRLSDGLIDEVRLNPDIVRAARLLTDAPNRYFLTSGSLLLPISELLLTRTRPEGIAHALVLMKAAYDGKHPRRPPVEVEKLADHLYLVHDGNSTTAVAMAAGWPIIPCVLR